MHCVDLKDDALTILGTHFSYYKKKKKRKKFYTVVTSIQRQLEIRKIINLILEGKKVIFKKLTMSKFVFQSLITTALKHIVNELEKKQTSFLWINSSPKIKYKTLCND